MTDVDTMAARVTNPRKRVVRDAHLHLYDQDAEKPKPYEPIPRWTDPLLMPLSYHRFDACSDEELSVEIRKCRLFDAHSDDVLQLLCTLKRRSRLNECDSMLEYLINQR